MKINFANNINQHADYLVRRCGYGQIRDSRSGETSYVRRLRTDFYPRFHLYINSENPLVLNLHLDQKKASYEGFTAHSGDYDSDLVKQEGERIYNLIISESQQSLQKEEEPEEKKGFWAGLFGK